MAKFSTKYSWTEETSYGIKCSICRQEIPDGEACYSKPRIKHGASDDDYYDCCTLWIHAACGKRLGIIW